MKNSSFCLFPGDRYCAATHCDNGQVGQHYEFTNWSARNWVGLKVLPQIPFPVPKFNDQTPFSHWKKAKFQFTFFLFSTFIMKCYFFLYYWYYCVYVEVMNNSNTPKNKCLYHSKMFLIQAYFFGVDMVTLVPHTCFHSARIQVIILPFYNI